MRTYNLYYKQERINKRPLSKEELDYIKQYEVIRKVDDKSSTNKQIHEIPVKALRIVEQITF